MQQQKSGINIRRAPERGMTRTSWLESFHTFSFGDYYEPQHMGFRTLRVINDDTIQPGSGFKTHGHRDMEILSHVVEGELEHRDSMGNGSVIHSGDFQRMSAGTGVRHSEFNPSSGRSGRFLQIWILPARNGLKPSYEQKSLNDLEEENGLYRVADSGGDGAIKIHQDVAVFYAKPQAGQMIRYSLREERGLWLQVISGAVKVSGFTLAAGDGASAEVPGRLDFEAQETSAFLLFDMK